jgi:hypothetical protein
MIRPSCEASVYYIICQQVISTAKAGRAAITDNGLYFIAAAAAMKYRTLSVIACYGTNLTSLWFVTNEFI